MGNKASAEKLRSKKLSLRLKQEKQQEAMKLKLLLLGAGESGKSTIFKQMKLLYGEGYTAEERFKMRPFLWGNIVEGAIDIYEASEALGITLGKDAIKAGKFLQTVEDKRTMNDDIADAINSLWTDDNIGEVWEQRSKYQVQDTFADFAHAMKNYPEWGGQKWTPTTDEILRCRVRTTGIIDELFTLKGVKLRMMDVGGQRSERRKWINCFDDVTSVLFVAALSGYDSTLFEDSSQNRLTEALDLFGEIVNNSVFAQAAMLLFLNKDDLLYEKYVERKIPLNISGLFPSAPVGEPDMEEAHKWFADQFRSRCKDKTRPIYIHFTCATDTKLVDSVMKTCSAHILKKNLERSGIIA